MFCSDGVIMCTGGAENAPDVKAFDMYGNEIEISEFDIDKTASVSVWIKWNWLHQKSLSC